MCFGLRMTCQRTPLLVLQSQVQLSPPSNQFFSEGRKSVCAESHTWSHNSATAMCPLCLDHCTCIANSADVWLPILMLCVSVHECKMPSYAGYVCGITFLSALRFALKHHCNIPRPNYLPGNRLWGLMICCGILSFPFLLILCFIAFSF